MTIDVQSPSGGPDLSLKNPRNTSYVQSNENGDSNTKEAFRFKITLDNNKNKNLVTVQARRLTGSGAQVWRDSTVKSGSGSVQIGSNLTISPTGGFIRTSNSAEINPELFSLIPAVPFDADGTDFLVTPVLDRMIIDPIFPGPTTSEIINTTIGQICPVGTGRVVETIIHEAGSVSANTEVQYTIYVGTDNTGSIIFQELFSPTVFTANQPITIFLDSSVVFEAGTSVFLEMTSVNSFSVDTNTLGDVITSLDKHDLELVGVITENLVLDQDLNTVLDGNLNPVYAGVF